MSLKIYSKDTLENSLLIKSTVNIYFLLQDNWLLKNDMDMKF